VIWRLIKTAIFTLVAPGTVALYLPAMLRERSADHAIHSFYLYPWLALFLCGAAIYLLVCLGLCRQGTGNPGANRCAARSGRSGAISIHAQSDVPRRSNHDQSPGGLLPLALRCGLPALCCACISHLREALRRAHSSRFIRRTVRDLLPDGSEVARPRATPMTVRLPLHYTASHAI